MTYKIAFSLHFDVSHSGAGGQTVPTAYLWIDEGGETIRVIVEQTNPAQTGFDPANLLAVPLEYGDSGESGEPRTPQPEAFEALVRSEQANALLQRIAAGYGQEWPDPNRPGDGFKQATLDADAEAALAELNFLIADLPADTRVAWSSEDWFASVSWDAVDATEVDEMIANPTGGDDDVYLADDPVEHVMRLFVEYLSFGIEGDNAESDLLIVRGAAVLVRRDADGDIECVTECVTPAGNRWRHTDVPPDDLITQAECAKLFEKSIQAVNNALRDGRLTGYTKPGGVAHRPGDRMVSLAAARRLWGEK